VWLNLRVKVVILGRSVKLTGVSMWTGVFCFRHYRIELRNKGCGVFESKGGNLHTMANNVMHDTEVGHGTINEPRRIIDVVGI
jgi:hypothetical protein